MGKEFDLLNEDYLNIIKDCETAISTRTVQQKIIEKYKKYKGDNPSFLQSLITVLDQYYPELVIYGYSWEQQKEYFERYELFSEVPSNGYSKNQLVYLSAFVIHLFENYEETSLDISKSVGLSDLSNSAKAVKSRTFTSHYSRGNLIKLHKCIVTLYQNFLYDV